MSTLKTPLRKMADVIFDADSKPLCYASSLHDDKSSGGIAAELALAYNSFKPLRDALLRQLHSSPTNCTCAACESSRTLIADIDAAEAQLTQEER